MKINGKEIADEIVSHLKESPKPKKKLIAISIGDDMASESFLKQKERVAKELGINFYIKKINTRDDVYKNIERVIKNEDTGGIIIQLPLPKSVDVEKVIAMIPINIDVDVLSGHSGPLLAPSVGVVEEILIREKVNLKSSVVAVLGLGRLVGDPISKWLQGRCSELYLLDDGDDISQIKNADIIISGVGKKGIIDSKSLKANAGVIDFGYAFHNGRVFGDLLDKDIGHLAFYTPTPGGTGPILVSKIFENFYKLCEQ